MFYKHSIGLLYYSKNILIQVFKLIGTSNLMKIALYQPDIAGNVGTILRLGACMGIDVDIIEPCGFPFDMKKIHRAGMDYIDHVKINRYISFEEFLEKNRDSRIILLTTKVDKSYTEFKFEKNDILLAGRESAGVPDEVANKCDKKVTIKMKNNMRSLNIAISVAMVLGEAIKQVE
jgi:tRNA (cytidine/uridine-2'-O-)-methyltransferase